MFLPIGLFLPFEYKEFLLFYPYFCKTSEDGSITSGHNNLKRQTMANELAKSVNDFSFGMLFMAQLLLTAIMYHKGRSHSLQRMMFFFMAYLLGITAFEIVFFYLPPKSHGTLTSWFTDIVEMTVVPCAYFIIVRLTHPNARLRSAITANALLYGLALLAFAVSRNKYVYMGTLIFTLLYSLFIIGYGVVSVRRFNKLLADNFSDDNLSLYWLKYIVYLYIGIIGVWTFATITANEYSVAMYNATVIVAFSMFCYFVYKQEDMLEALKSTGIAYDNDTDDYNANEGNEGCGKGNKSCDDGNEGCNEDNNDGEATGDCIQNTKDYHFADSMERIFSEKELYLDPTLNINELAHQLGTNRTYISNYLNRQLHTTFYEYVNQWRIRRAKDLLEHTSLTLDQIAGKSGFNSQSSFRRYFTAATGTTPSTYRKRVCRQRD